MELSSLHDLFVAELKDLYSAEKQLLKALPKMAKGATSKALKNGFERHLKQTEKHVERLEQVCGEFDVSPGGKKCKAMEALVMEGDEMLKSDAEPEAMDAALIAAAQKVEHYEMAGYGCVRTYSKLLGSQKSARLLQKTLDEEGATDKKLTQLAQKINVKAEEAPEKRNGSAKSRSAKPLTNRILQAVGLES
jgi:ferritin-like metal-binding protein YciE